MTVAGERLQRELERALRALRHGDEIEALRIVRDLAAESVDCPRDAERLVGRAGTAQ